jgi:uncharacterized protein with LGFP repeats
MLESAIYWSPETGAHVIEGEILTLWRTMGAEKSSLGYPISNETNTPDGNGRMIHFQYGDIVWHDDTGLVVEMAPRSPAPPPAPSSAAR